MLSRREYDKALVAARNFSTAELHAEFRLGVQKMLANDPWVRFAGIVQVDIYAAAIAERCVNERRKEK